MSSLIYNGVSLDIVKTHEVSFNPVFDVDGSYLYTRIAISVSGLVNPNATSYIGVLGLTIAIPGSSPTASVQAIRHILAQPRGNLVYDAGGSPNAPLVVSPGAGFSCDANNGPVPGPLTVTEVNGTKSFHVNFSIETWVIECNNYGSSIVPSALISNRYGQTHSIDALHYTTITTTGQALFRTDLLEKANQTADQYRSFLFPPVPGGFQRKAINIAITPSRNALTYQIIDVEKPFDLANPRGVVECKANYSVSSTGTKDGGMVSMMTLHQIQIQASGDKNSSNWELTKFCIALAQARLPIGDANRGFVRQIAVSQSLTDRSVSLTVIMMLFPKKQGALGAIDTDALRADEVFPAQGGRNPDMPSRKGAAGTYANNILVAAWKSACQESPSTQEGDYNPESSDPYVSPGSPTIQVTTTPDLPSYTTGYSTATTTRPYTDYSLTMEHETITNTMQVPLAGPAGDGGYVSGGEPSNDDVGRQTSAFLTLAPPMHRRIVRWTAERVGELPDVPSPNAADSNLVLIDTARVVTEAPNLLPDGETLCYRISGVYVFGLKRAPRLEDGLALGAMPWIETPLAKKRLPNSSFVTGIIDPGYPVAVNPVGPVGPDS